VPLKSVISPGTSLVTSTQTGATLTPLTRDEAVRLALNQASTFQQAGFNERLAAEDVRQARAAFLPRIAAAPSVIYTTPSISSNNAPGTPRPPSFIAANAVSEFQALANVTGELDVSGRLRATLNRNAALLEAARAGTEVARRTLILAIDDAYFALALASARRGAAEQNLAAAAEFERATSLLLSAGEVAPVDLTRARLQINTRRDELEQARANEAVAGDSLRLFVGYDFNQPIATTDLLIQMPQLGEVESFTADAIRRRPEFVQFDAERRAAEQDIRLARAERRPQVTYNISGGFDADSLRPPRIGQHAGASASIGLSIPIFDAGISRSRARQAGLRAQVAESTRLAALRSFAQGFYSARTQAFSAEARIRLASNGIRDAESNLTASLARYRAGEASIVEVTDAQNTLVTKRTNFYQAIFDYQTARARLMLATGR